jgi:hypothetical protein
MTWRETSVATIPAIALGHVARSQIRRTGEQGLAWRLRA